MPKIYNEKEVRVKYRHLTNLLIQNRLTISTMESATSGQIASLITDTEGASAVIKGAFVTYSNDAKIMNGVPADVIEKYSVYSKETASAMAVSCALLYNADIGIGVTGTMGNADPANPESSVPGQVYFAVAYKGITYPFFKEIPHQESRLMYKLAVADEVCDKIINILQKEMLPSQ